MHGSDVNLAPRGSRADELVRFVGFFKAGVGFFLFFFFIRERRAMPAQCVPLIGDSSLAVHTNVQNTMMRCMKEAHSRDPAESPGTVSIVVLGSIWALPQIRWATQSASFHGSPRVGEPAVLRVTFCWFAMLTADRSCGLPREACKHILFRDGVGLCSHRAGVYVCLLHTGGCCVTASLGSGMRNAIVTTKR